MRYFFLVFLTFCATILIAQEPLTTITVEQIMRNPDWIGSSPSGSRWLHDGRLTFRWNPDRLKQDSTYSISKNDINTVKIPHHAQHDLIFASQIIYNSNRTASAYELKGDIYLLSGKKGELTRVTNTLGRERLLGFAFNDTRLVYDQSGTLYSWSLVNGTTEQLTDVRTGSDPLLKKKEKETVSDKAMKADQLALFKELREQYEAEEAKKQRLKDHPEKVRLKPYYLGEHRSRHLSVSPSGRAIAMIVSEKDQNSKRTIVPNYVTLTGFTEDMNSRPKVGGVETPSSLVLFIPERDTFINVTFNDLPGIKQRPGFLSDYNHREDSMAQKANKSFSVGIPEWSPWSDEAVIQVYAHDNKDRWIILVNALNGETKLIDHQHDEAWIGGPGIGGSFWGGNLGWLDKDHIWFQSEVTGYSHLYVKNMRTGGLTPLTNGRFEVQQVIVTQKRDAFYLLTNESHPGKKEVEKITWPKLTKSTIIPALGGIDELQLSPDEMYLSYRASTANRPWELFLLNLKKTDKPVQITRKAASAEFLTYPWRSPDVITFPARDGEDVYARLYRPSNPDPLKPAVIFVHGAGYLQNAHHWWSSYFREYMFHNLLADMGYTVLDIDFRASSGYGRDWRTAIYRHMGGKDLDDNVDGAKYLVDSLGINPARIGLYGGSYGGFITLMALFTTMDVFASGAALRPVTDWAHYNHGYTSNILNTPVEDSIAFARSSPIFFAEGLKGDLLICHGMLDVNVHFQDVVRLQQRLIELGKENWEVAAYPLEDHAFKYPSSWTDEYKRILALFERTLRK